MRDPAGVAGQHVSMTSPAVAKMLIELQQIRKLADQLEKEITMNFDEWISTDTSDSNMDDFNEHASFDSDMEDECEFCMEKVPEEGWCCLNQYERYSDNS